MVAPRANLSAALAVALPVEEPEEPEEPEAAGALAEPEAPADIDIMLAPDAAAEP